MGIWDELRAATYTHSGASPKPVGDSELDAFEARVGIELPLPFREFAKTFGSCEIGRHSCKIFVPAPNEADGEPDGLARIHQDWHEMAADSADGARMGHYPMGNLEVGARLVFFGFDGGGDAYGWDPDEVTDAAAREYAIWVRAADCERVASSFAELVMDVLLKEDLVRWRDAGRPSGPQAAGSGEDLRILVTPL